jgi:autotransporter-associated beta strand protein
VFTAQTGAPAPGHVILLFGGTLTGTGGTLTILSDPASSAGLFEVSFSGGDYTMSRPIVLDNGGSGRGAVRLGDVSAAGTTHTYSGVISGTGAYLRDSGGLTVFLANNTYTGATILLNGTLQLGNGGTTGSLSPNSAITTGSGATLVFDHTSGADFVQGVNFNSGIIGGAQIVKEGTSSLTFNFQNTFTGGLIINKGTVIATVQGALGSGDVKLNADNVTLTLQGGTNPNFIADFGTLTIGFNTDVVNLNYTGTEVVAGLIVNGVSQAAGTYGSADFAQFMGMGTITVMPEPTTIALMALGTGLLVGVQRFRSKLR